MITIGHFRRDGEAFTGRLATLGLAATLRLAPAEKFSAKAPDFIATLSGAEGETECGAAWRLSDTSGAVLSLRLDDPTWAEPINARLMAAEDGVLPLVWIRRADPPPSASPPPSS